MPNCDIRKRELEWMLVNKKEVYVKTSKCKNIQNDLYEFMHDISVK